MLKEQSCYWNEKVAEGVFCFSELFFIKEPRDATVLRKDAVILDCQAQGEVPIHIRWLKSGSPLAETDRVYPLANGSLFISEAENRRGEKSDEGSYQCLAQNKYGAILSQKARLTIASISTFTQQPSSIVVTEGSVARFTCKISATPPPIITWEFNRVTLPLATDRITVLPSGVLQIQGVDRKDAGSYRCVAANIANRRRSVEATLTVTPAPSFRNPQRPHIIAGPQNITVATHGSALLECVAVGNPRPLISWSRADQKPIDVYNTKVLGNGNLLISDIKRQHAGLYVCRATTPGTRNYTVAAANVTVLAPPSLVEWPESLTRPRAGTGRFVCQAEGVPTPHITWLKNGEPVHSNGRIKMYNSKLVINQIIPEDDAIYQCQAENDQGSVLSTARLIVVMSEDRPSAPRNIHADTVSSSAILLAWERPLYNADKVIAYSIHYMKAEGLNNEEYQVVIGNDTTRYIIDDLEPAWNYTFYIVAYMPMGASRMSDHIIQHTLEDVPVRAPELSLTSRSPTDIQVSWLPLTHKLSRGRISAYRLWYRPSSDGATNQLELPGDQAQHLLEGLQPDTVYLLRIAAATSVGWCEPSAWTSHRTPKASSGEVPLAPELQLEPLNCTTVIVRWRQAVGTSVASLQGYRLFYREESQPESAPIQLPPHLNQHTIGGLDPRKKYHVKLLAFNFIGEGYQADRTISTPGCVSVRDRLVPPPPPPHHVYARTNSSSSIFLHWARPAFTGGQTVNYTVRCNPVGLQNASLVLYLQTGDQSLLVKDLEANTRYEFAVRLHVDQLTSPWSPVVYQRTLPDAPSLPPVGVKVTLIEGDTALVSWKPPNEPNVAVTRYTILYASRKAWVAGKWQILQREGSITMALLENLQPGNVYLVKVSASNQMGDGPFSPAVELTVNANGHTSGHASRSHGSAHATVFSVINSFGPVRPTAEKKEQKWNLFRKEGKVKKVPGMSSMYQPGTTLLCYSDESPGGSSLQHPSSFHALLGPQGGDTEGSHSSEGSHETGDSGRYSHDETEMTNLSLSASSRPASLSKEESGGSDREECEAYLTVELEDITSPSAGGDGGLDGLGGPGLLLGSPDKKKRKSSTQAPTFPPLSEYAPPANPSSDHLVASNPFDDNYSSPPPSLKALNPINPYFGPSPYPGFSGYGPPRMVPHIQNRMPSPYGGPYQIRNQPPHPFAQNPMGPMGMAFNRPPGFNYGHPDNPAFANQPMFNNGGGGGMHLPHGQPFRPGPGENLNQLPLPNVNQNQSGPDGPGYGPEGSGNLPPTIKPSPDMSPGIPQPPSNFGQSNTPTPKQDPNEATSNKNAGQNATPPRKQNQTPEDGGGAQDTQVEPKGKNRGNVSASLDGGVEKINGMIHPGTDPLKKSPQPRIETPAERTRRPGTTRRSGTSLAHNKSSAHPGRPNNSASSSEPVYPCGICLSEVNDDQEAILCEASCQKWFHRVCTGMTETAYNLLTAEMDAVWGCDGCMEEKGAQLLKTREAPGPPTATSEGQS
ncbi:hypothetical protein NFI96_000956 [Prochilodus magdalenae]|nr:hypothetical protein NFI96_000956 [Prochilodus magdalenae]